MDPLPRGGPPQGGVDPLPRGGPPQEGGARRNPRPAAVPKVAFRGADHRAEAAYRVGGVPRDQGEGHPMGGGLRLAGEPREVVARPKVEVHLFFLKGGWFASQMRQSFGSGVRVEGLGV